MDCRPIYAAAALAFNRVGFASWEEFVAALGANIQHVLLREYWDVVAWSHSMPLSNGENEARILRLLRQLPR
jgi:hypothetical protein